MKIAACPHRPACPGCPRFGQPGIATDTWETLLAFCRLWGIGVPRVWQGEPLGFRQRARLAVRGRSRAPKVGIFAAGTHQVIDIPHCPIHKDPINATVAAFKEAVQRTATPLYSERAHAGLVRYLQLVVERGSGKIQLVVVCNADDPRSSQPLLSALGELLGERLHSLFWNGQPEARNHILGSKWHHERGPEALREHLGGADVYYPPAAFGQANLDLFERIVEHVHERIEPNAPVVELYCGVGAMGLGLAARGQQVVFNEVAPGSLRGLQLGIEALPSAQRANVRVMAGAAEDCVSGLPLEGAHVLVDPPRSGLHADVVRALCTRQPERLSYLSCGQASFLRDAEQLLRAGFQCTGLDAYALFPFTEHVEILAHFERGTGRPGALLHRSEEEMRSPG